MYIPTRNVRTALLSFTAQEDVQQMHTTQQAVLTAFTNLAVSCTVKELNVQ